MKPNWREIWDAIGIGLVLLITIICIIGYFLKTD